MAHDIRIAALPGALGFDPEQPGSNGEFHRHAYDRLFTYRPRTTATGEVIGDPPHIEGALAERYETSADGLTYRVFLRKGIFSASGNELTADDVKWSWDRAFALRDVGKWIAMIGSVMNAGSVTAVDRYTVDFRMRAPNPTLLQQLTRATPAIHDSTEIARHDTDLDPWARDWLRKNPAGFGRYRLEQVEAWKGAEFCLHANTPSAAIERVIYTFVAGSHRRLAMLRRGEVDLLVKMSPAEYASLDDAPGIHRSRTASGAHIALIPHVRHAPFDRPAVRKALAYAVPYERILNEVFLGLARPWHSMLPTTVPMANEEGWPYHYDPDRAKHYLAEAGLASGFETELFVDAANDEERRTGEIITEALQSVGIRAVLEPLETAVFWPGGRYFRPYPLVVWSGHDQVPDPYYALVHDFGPAKMGLTNCGQYENAEYFALLDQVEREPREAERAALVRQAQNILVDDCAIVPLVQPDFLSAMNERLKGFYLPPDGFFLADRLYWDGER